MIRSFSETAGMSASAPQATAGGAGEGTAAGEDAAAARDRGLQAAEDADDSVFHDGVKVLSDATQGPGKAAYPVGRRSHE